MDDKSSKNRDPNFLTAIGTEGTEASADEEQKTGILQSAFNGLQLQKNDDYEEQRSEPEIATRMTPIEHPQQEEEIVIASSRIQSIDDQQLVAQERSTLDRRPKISRHTVRDRERHRGRLIVTYQSNQTTHYVESELITIGRGDENDVRLEDPKVSREHLRIEQTLDSHRVFNLSSRNSIRVDGQKTRSKEVFHGSMIRLGDTTIRYESIGWAIKPSNTKLDTNLLNWAQVIEQLSKADRSRLAIFSISLSFLIGGFVFLLMSFLDYPGQPDIDTQSLSYRRQAEKRALSGDLKGALDSLNKVAFLAGELSPRDIKRRDLWSTRKQETEIARQIQVQTLADPLPKELDELIAQLSRNPSILAEAKVRVSQAKLRFLSRALEKRKRSKRNQKQLEALYHDIDVDLVDRRQYEAVSRRLFPRKK